MVNIPDAAVQAALEYYSEGGCMGLDSYERQEVATAMLEAALPYLQSGFSTKPVDVAEVRRQAFEDAANIAKDWWHNPKQERPDMAIRAASAELAQED